MNVTAFEPRCSVHPAKHELLTFLRGELPTPRAAPIVRHLLTGCPECLEVTRPIWEVMAPRPILRRGRP